MNINYTANKQLVLEGILRKKIFACKYWKEKCYALNAETIIDRAIEIKYIGGAYGKIGTPTDFICLILKLLQISPDLEIIYEYLHNPDYKYLTAIAAFYVRLAAKPKDVYKLLEPLYEDYRKICVRGVDGSFTVSYMDVYVNELIKNDTCLGITLPKIPCRSVLVDSNELEEYVSLINKMSEPSKEDRNRQKFVGNLQRLIKLNGYSLDYEDSDDELNRINVKGRDIYSEVVISQSSEKNNNIEEFSVDYWNSIRASLGIPLLK